MGNPLCGRPFQWTAHLASYSDTDQSYILSKNICTPYWKLVAPALLSYIYIWVCASFQAIHVCIDLPVFFSFSFTLHYSY